MQKRLRMDEQKILDALIARADEDVRRFREQNPGDVPTERWIENSYTAALPLAKADAGLDLGPGPYPALFDAYRREIASRLGERADRRDSGATVQSQPTPGER